VCGGRAMTSDLLARRRCWQGVALTSLSRFAHWEVSLPQRVLISPHEADRADRQDWVGKWYRTWVFDSASTVCRQRDSNKINHSW
jgi:hypothetical protein